MVSLSACTTMSGMFDPCAKAFNQSNKRSAPAEEIIENATACINRTDVSVDRRASAYWVRASQKLDLGDYKGAAEDYELSMVVRPPKTAWDLIMPAIAYRKAGQYEKSLTALKRAKDEGLGMVGKGSGLTMPYYYHLGITLQEMGRHKEAIEAFDRGIPFQPDYPGVYWYRGLSYEALGDKENARADFVTLSDALTKQNTARKTRDDRYRKDAEDFRREYIPKLKEYGIPIPPPLP